MESLKPDCSYALRRKRPQSLPAKLSRTLSPVRFESKSCGIAPISCNSQSNPGGFLCTSDCVAERVGFETLGTGLNRARGAISVGCTGSTTLREWSLNQECNMASARWMSARNALRSQAGSRREGPPSRAKSKSRPRSVATCGIGRRVPSEAPEIGKVIELRRDRPDLGILADHFLLADDRGR